MAYTTQALVAEAANKPLKLQEVQLDELRRDESLVEIHAIGICHGELACIDGKMPVKFPSVLGHEG